MLTIETLRRRYERFAKLIIKTPERCHSSRSGVFIVSFEHVSITPSNCLLGKQKKKQNK